MPWKRPTIQTPFHVDWQWWTESDPNYRFTLFEQLCEVCRQRFPSPAQVDEVDWIDPETAMVTRADALMMCLQEHCVLGDQYVNQSLPLTSAIFRLFMQQGNRPLTPEEIHEHIYWRPAKTILKLIGGRQTHYGIRPVE
ncbi:MAG: hypothetical protein GXP37_12630 [Chloroflexi bacterium]|nr:hypothetical protein [Chloroflexota bacterium]